MVGVEEYNSLCAKKENKGAKYYWTRRNFFSTAMFLQKLIAFLCISAFQVDVRFPLWSPRCPSSQDCYSVGVWSLSKSKSKTICLHNAMHNGLLACKAPRPWYVPTDSAAAQDIHSTTVWGGGQHIYSRDASYTALSSLCVSPTVLQKFHRIGGRSTWTDINAHRCAHGSEPRKRCQKEQKN